MLFSSMIFLWIFLPVVLAGSFLLRKPRWVNPFLVLASLFFYAWGEPVNVLIMLFSILLNYGAGLLLARFEGEDPYDVRKLVLTLDILLNLALLGYFKYMGLLMEGLNAVLALYHGGALEVPAIALPIGISFFTFQALSYVVDVYRGQVQAQRKLINVALYISFFPQLIAGPIVRYREINEQIENRTVTWDGFALGARRFIYGLSKKVLIANVVARGADALYKLDVGSVTGGMAWLAAILYTFQIYYDFSGYSDMAIGLGRMFGFTFSENFNYPYLSRSIREFWRRWHISLSAWFREYVYIPLGGNRKGAARTYLNLCIVFLLTGIWHGAGVTFILWGAYHGLFSVLERLGLGKLLKKLGPVGWLYAFLVAVFGWVLFRVEDAPAAFQLMGRMLTPWRYTVTPLHLYDYVTRHMLMMLPLAFLGMGPVQALAEKTGLAKKWKYSLPEAIFCAALLAVCIGSLASSSYNPFIYFKF
ncbi:MAG: MBOAT family protein [Clostridia bacterium]|nr:MBOAT family protein [Clostridia bacterium]